MGSGQAERGEHQRTVVHILPYDLARGAQSYARALVDLLDSPDEGHLILTLFAAEPVLLRADVRLDVPQGRLRDLGLDPRAVLRLRKALRGIRPAAVVAHGGEPAKYAAIAAPRRLPLVYLSIGSAHPGLRRPLSRVLHRMYTRRADVVVAVSTDVADEAHSLHGVSRERLVIIPNGRDASAFQPRREQSDRGKVRLISVGHLDQGKRPDWFIEVVRALRERGHQIEALMVGEGPLEDRIRPAAAGAGVTMLGRRDDVPDLLAGSDVLVFTSRPPEGMPGVLIEAGLSGLATVSTRIPGSGDVVEDGVTGLLVDTDDLPGMIDAVHRLVSDEVLRVSMGRRARERCLAQFTLEAGAGKWREVLNDLMGPVGAS